MDLEKLKKIRTLVLIGMFADDELMDIFVLKGGSAMDLAYKIDSRASVDVDLSVKDDFKAEELVSIGERIEASLEKVFASQGYIIFDYEFSRRPGKDRPGRPSFWGGYGVKFKILPEDRKDMLSDLNKARKLAEVVGFNQVKTFKVDISKYEYCDEKQEMDIDGYTIYVYTPKMLAIEKLRAICQGMEEYPYRTEKAPRTKDFYDIYTLVENFKISFSGEDLELAKKVFELKEVPLELLDRLPNYREHFKAGLEALRDTVPQKKILEFDSYFDLVLNIAARIKSGDRELVQTI